FPPAFAADAEYRQVRCAAQRFFPSSAWALPAPCRDPRECRSQCQQDRCDDVPTCEGEAKKAPSCLVATDHAGVGEVIEEAARPSGQWLRATAGLRTWPKFPLRAGVVGAERSIGDKSHGDEREKGRCRTLVPSGQQAKGKQ